MKKKILFMCTGNSCRSQMAEAWTRYEYGDIFEVYSAGLIKHGLDPRAVKVLSEAGLDISHQFSKTVDELPNQQYDAIITLCNQANESCPFFPGQVKRLHKSFDDPPSMAMHAPDQESALKTYRRVRDQIHEYVLTLPDILTKENQN